MSKSGVISLGVKTPFIREGRDIIKIVCDCVLPYIEDGDIIGITESVVARSNGLYVSIDEISNDIKRVFGDNAHIAIYNAIFSRNRFSSILTAIAKAASKISFYYSDFDEVGNYIKNQYTGIDIIEFYKDVCVKETCEFEAIYCTENIEEIVKNSHKNILCCSLRNFPQDKNIYTLKDFCTNKNPDFGLLGSNLANEEKLKLFPTKKLSEEVCFAIKDKIKRVYGINVTVMIFGDGCYKDATSGIWEFADPVTSPGYTDKELLESTPNEVKLKMLIDNSAGDAEVRKRLHENKSENNKLGTTPRKRVDLLASLMDLTTGSGDRQTPVVIVKNYF